MENSDFANYPAQPDTNRYPSEPAGVHRDDEWFDPQGIYRGEYDTTNVFTPQSDPVTPWWEK